MFGHGGYFPFEVQTRWIDPMRSKHVKQGSARRRIRQAMTLDEHPGFWQALEYPRPDCDDSHVDFHQSIEGAESDFSRILYYRWWSRCRHVVQGPIAKKSRIEPKQRFNIIFIIHSRWIGISVRKSVIHCR